MTFVSCLITQDFISLCSDGRAVANGQPHAEDVCKFTLPSPSTFIAWGGSSELIRQTMTETKLSQRLASGEDPRRLAETVQAALSDADPERWALFVFGRVGQGVCSVSSGSPSECYPQPPAGQARFFLIRNDGEKETESYEHELFRLLQQGGRLTPESCLDAQRALQYLAAQQDPTVNLKVFTAIVKPERNYL